MKKTNHKSEFPEIIGGNVDNKNHHFPRDIRTLDQTSIIVENGLNHGNGDMKNGLNHGSGDMKNGLNHGSGDMKSKTKIYGEFIIKKKTLTESLTKKLKLNIDTPGIVDLEDDFSKKYKDSIDKYCEMRNIVTKLNEENLIMHEM